MKFYGFRFNKSISKESWSTILADGLKIKPDIFWYTNEYGFFYHEENINQSINELIGLWESELSTNISMLITHKFDNFSERALLLLDSYQRGILLNLSEVVLLAIINNEESFIDEFFDYFSAVDSELLKTMEAYLNNDLSAIKAAESVFIHRNTWLYRYQKFQNISGINLQDLDDASFFRLWLSLQKIT